METPPLIGEPESRRYGRGVFFTALAGGVSSLLWGKAAWSVSGVVSLSRVQLRRSFRPGGWRIYTVSGQMPVFDPSARRLSIGGLVERPTELTYHELRALPSAEQVSTGR